MIQTQEQFEAAKRAFELSMVLQARGEALRLRSKFNRAQNEHKQALDELFGDN